jgi:hypothetical protein
MKKKELLIYVIHQKGIAIGTHDIRSGRDYTSNIFYACSVQGRDQTSIAEIPIKRETNSIL